MNRVEAVVTRVEGETAWVRTAGAGRACGQCAQGGEGCHSAVGKAEKERLLALPNTIGARVGDEVWVCARDGAVWRAALLAYALPLACAGVVAWPAFHFSGSEEIGFLGLVGGLALGFAALRRLTARRGEPILTLQFKDGS